MTCDHCTGKACEACSIRDTREPCDHTTEARHGDWPCTTPRRLQGRLQATNVRLAYQRPDGTWVELPDRDKVPAPLDHLVFPGLDVTFQVEVNPRTVAELFARLAALAHTPVTIPPELKNDK